MSVAGRKPAINIMEQYIVSQNKKILLPDEITFGKYLLFIEISNKKRYILQALVENGVGEKYGEVYKWIPLEQYSNKSYQPSFSIQNRSLKDSLNIEMPENCRIVAIDR